MADLQWMKWWIRDHMGDTGHLSLAEHGVHCRLLCLAWDSPHCSIPSDRKWIKRRLGIDDEAFQRDVRPVIEELWTEEDGRLWQKRQRKEFSEALASAHRRSAAGKQGANARHNVTPLKRKD